MRGTRIVILVACAAALSSCQLIQTLFGAGTGTVKLTAYSEIFLNSPPGNSQKVGSAVVEISPAIGGRTLYATDDYGMLTINSVPAGQYAVTPFGAGTAYSKTIFVSDGDTTSQLVLTPRATFVFCYLNVNSGTAPFAVAGVRTALAEAVDRDTLHDAVSAEWPSSEAAANYIPGVLDAGGWADGSAATAFSASTADTDLQAATGSSFALNLSVDTNPGPLTLANDLISYFSGMTRVSAAQVTSSSHDQLAADLASGTFDAAIGTYTLLTNNLADFYSAVFDGPSDYGGFHDSTLLADIQAASTALDAGNRADYVAAILAANRELVTSGAVIPLLWQTQ